MAAATANRAKDWNRSHLMPRILTELPTPRISPLLVTVTENTVVFTMRQTASHWTMRG